jgi:predicted XRE-type DNA-binding protein
MFEKGGEDKMTYEEINDKLMNQINELIKKYGIKASHISKLTHINNAYFSLWRNGRKYLNEESIKAVEDYLSSFQNSN